MHKWNKAYNLHLLYVILSNADKNIVWFDCSGRHFLNQNIILMWEQGQDYRQYISAIMWSRKHLYCLIVWVTRAFMKQAAYELKNFPNIERYKAE